MGAGGAGASVTSTRRAAAISCSTPVARCSSAVTCCCRAAMCSSCNDFSVSLTCRAATTLPSSVIFRPNCCASSSRVFSLFVTSRTSSIAGFTALATFSAASALSPKSTRALPALCCQASAVTPPHVDRSLATCSMPSPRRRKLAAFAEAVSNSFSRVSAFQFLMSPIVAISYDPFPKRPALPSSVPATLVVASKIHVACSPT
ncbi:Uncharacterised protein [Mycobacteroides abscessus subsp. abscessus]|nr:Uncharacterised protein [Mycobacteroides abscessus subsp. abscessus]